MFLWVYAATDGACGNHFFFFKLRINWGLRIELKNNEETDAAATVWHTCVFVTNSLAEFLSRSDKLDAAVVSCWTHTRWSLSRWGVEGGGWLNTDIKGFISIIIFVCCYSPLIHRHFNVQLRSTTEVKLKSQCRKVSKCQLCTDFV